MQTNIHQTFKNVPKVQEAEAILRTCVHCGFCTATCPTYQLLGDELDGPRGRIYLIKELLEGGVVTANTQRHLDRCLTCRACETTCPSGVRYGRLVEIGRHFVEHKVGRKPMAALVRWLLRKIIPHPQRFAFLLQVGRLFRPVLPGGLQQKIPQVQVPQPWPCVEHARKMLVLQGCAQSVVTANTNVATARVLDRLGITLLVAKLAGCCGAVSHHLSAEAEGLAAMRRNIDAWWPYVEANTIEAIVITASGCGAMVKEYGELLRDDAQYADKAACITALAKDISEILRDETLTSIAFQAVDKKVAFHSPCTLQHAQRLGDVVEGLLRNAGYELTAVADAHLCCGSAGTYSVLQPKLAKQLLANKLNNLQQQQPDVIATANIGCQMHLAGAAQTPVIHWIELIDAAL